MSSPELIVLNANDRKELIDRIQQSSLSKEDRDVLCAALETLSSLNNAYRKNTTSIKRLLKIIFGSKSEKSKDILKNESDDKSSSDEKSSEKKKPKGHGRNGADAFTGADKKFIPHPDFIPGDQCPLCIKGKIYRLETPQVLVSIEGHAPLSAKVTEFDQLRCNLCGEIFTSKPPETEKARVYDESARAIIPLLKYGCGFPFYRFENLQKSVGIPLPSSTQWDIVKTEYENVYPVYLELKKLAAQGDILHNDDTNNRILELMAQENTSGRTGIFTTGIIAVTGSQKIALFFSGRNHAGENLSDVLSERDKDRSPPIQMCDALSRNCPKGYETQLCNCLTHGRRYFVDEVSNFPDETKHVIKIIREVYKNDDIAKERSLSDQERLIYHQKHSEPLMDSLYDWFNEQVSQKKVEPNSGLGEAISYMLKHWEPLTRFLKVPGAPLDNNVCERALKLAILNRKNAYFYKTCFGAAVGDVFMSIIHTCSLCGANPFRYLVAILKNTGKVLMYPEKWLPWNYHQAAAEIPS